MPSQLTPQDITYLNELAADIAAHGGFNGMPVEEAVEAAHERRQAFAMELAQAATKRTQMARRALNTSIWITCQVIAAKERLVMQASDSTRQFFLECDFIESN
ncbi:MAG: hypothetical protein V4713_03665 [Pseudomonadota bacterium]